MLARWAPEPASSLGALLPPAGQRFWDALSVPLETSTLVAALPILQVANRVLPTPPRAQEYRVIFVGFSFGNRD